MDTQLKSARPPAFAFTRPCPGDSETADHKEEVTHLSRTSPGGIVIFASGTVGVILARFEI